MVRTRDRQLSGPYCITSCTDGYVCIWYLEQHKSSDVLILCYLLFNTCTLCISNDDVIIVHWWGMHRAMQPHAIITPLWLASIASVNAGQFRQDTQWWPESVYSAARFFSLPPIFLNTSILSSQSSLPLCPSSDVAIMQGSLDGWVVSLAGRITHALLCPIRNVVHKKGAMGWRMQRTYLAHNNYFDPWSLPSQLVMVWGTHIQCTVNGLRGYLSSGHLHNNTPNTPNVQWSPHLLLKDHLWREIHVGWGRERNGTYIR